MDRQKMFDRAWHYYVTEGHPPSAKKLQNSDKTGPLTCLYFNPETGDRCAIGIQLTPDQAKRLPFGPIYVLLKDDCRHGYIDALALRGEELRVSLGVESHYDIDFLAGLQDAHDHAAVGRGYFPALFRANMRILAAHWNLTVPGGTAPEAAAGEEEVLCAQ